MRRPLATRLLLPYVLLLLLLAGAIGWLSYNASRRTVDALSGKLLGSVADRVAGATRAQLLEASLLLSSVFAFKSEGDLVVRGPPGPFDNDVALERRFFEMTAVRSVTHYVYYGREDGTFVGVERQVDEAGKDLRVVTRIVPTPGAARQRYDVSRPGDRSRGIAEPVAYNPRERPWYRAAAANARPTWSPIYTSFSSGRLAVTHAQPVYGNGGKLHGVLAADVTLDDIARFLTEQRVSERGVAFIVGADGAVVVSSARAGAGAPPLQREAVDALRSSRSGGRELAFLSSLGKAQASVRHLADGDSELHGLDWRVVVAAPQADFTTELAANNRITIGLALLAGVIAAMIGSLVLRAVAREVADLVTEVDRLGEGVWPEGPPPARSGELGRLTTAFHGMAERLRISQAELRQSNEALEARVAARTSELQERNISLAKEVLERKRAEFQFRQLSAAVEQAADGMLIVSPQGEVVYANPAYERMSGLRADDLKGQVLPALESAAVLGGPFAEIRQRIAKGEPYRGVALSRRKDGTGYYAEKTITPIHDDEGELRAFAWVERDVTQRERQREEMERKLELDALTGLYNRESIIAKLNQAIGEARERGGAARVAVVFMDLDGFKAVNDAFGHDVGDQALIESARRLKAALRGRDALARVGGDEFVAVLSDLRDRAGADAVANKFAQALEPEFVCSEQRFRLGTSQGIAIFPDDDVRVDELMRLADQAMLANKRERKAATGRARGEAFAG